MPKPANAIGPAHASGRAESMRIELLPDGQLPRETRAIDNLEPVDRGRADGGGHEVVRLEVGIAAGGRLEAHALEARADEVGRGPVLLGVGEPAAQRIASQKEEIGTQILLPDRFVLRCALLRENRREEHDHAERNDREDRRANRFFAIVATFAFCRRKGAFQHQSLNTCRARVWSGKDTSASRRGTPGRRRRSRSCRPVSDCWESTASSIRRDRSRRRRSTRFSRA